MKLKYFFPINCQLLITQQHWGEVEVQETAASVGEIIEPMMRRMIILR